MNTGVSSSRIKSALIDQFLHLPSGLSQQIAGWEAPALTALSRAPVPWNAAELYRYLRLGHTQQHGIAAGPMGAVVTELGALPDADIAAMASYLASFNQPITDAQSQIRAI